LSIIGVILAGGEGKRFRPLTYYIPKSMIPVGRSERPILEFIILWMRKWSISDIIILVGYKWRQITNYFGDGSRFNVKMKFVVDKHPYSNTGGALRRALDLGLLDGYSDALVWYGDIIAPIKLGELIEKHYMSESDVTIAVSSNYKVPVGVVSIGRDMNILSMVEKPDLNLNANIGVLVLKISSLKRVLENSNLGFSFDIAGDLIPAMIRNGMKVKAYIHEDIWYDIGSIERYEKIDHEKIEDLLEINSSIPSYVYI